MSSLDFGTGSWVDYLRFGRQRFFWGRRGVGDHYIFTADDRKVAYAYVRKNACTSFKEIICKTSDHRHEQAGFSSEIAFMGRYHLARSLSELRACDARIFVFRDPVERAVSVFVDKFVMDRNGDDIQRSFRTATGVEPGDASFRFFVENYLSQEQSQLDPHCVAQVRHLAPINYTHAIPIEKLSVAIRPVVGKALASKYFSRPVNQSAVKRYEEPAADLPAKELQARYEREGEVPSSSGLVGSNLSRALEHLYAEDYNLMRLLGAADGTKGSSRRAVNGHNGIWL